jgi:hypothetical protein
MSLSNSLPIRSGFANFFQPYSATILPTTTSIEQSSLTKFAGGYWILYTNYEVIVSAKRLQRDNVDVQLGNIEREIMKIVCLYTPDQIIGIEDMTYLGQERLYGIGDSFAKSDWATRIIISVKYHVTNEDPF